MVQTIPWCHKSLRVLADSLTCFERGSTMRPVWQSHEVRLWSEFSDAFAALFVISTGCWLHETKRFRSPPCSETRRRAKGSRSRGRAWVVPLAAARDGRLWQKRLLHGALPKAADGGHGAAGRGTDVEPSSRCVGKKAAASLNRR